MNPSPVYFVVAVVVATGVSACCCSPCEPRRVDSAPSIPAPAAVRGVTRIINGRRGVVVASGMWEDRDAIHRAADLLRERGIFSYGSTGIGAQLIVASEDLAAARRVLRADGVCSQLAMPDE